ncbi:MAG: DNA mismatch repair endonuclease MutL [Paludibacteraceae bacterium]|nr:DNA mismatch repair endonuclease MutL [Paludibacteraceae bacterium]
MDIIHLLPDSVANQIAAGEVIQRPASCLKELVENSLDAGAKHVDIIVTDAGRTLLQVVDNGMGMSPTDARMAFERHATSKISKAADLFNLHTMGFRGEALPSVAAVAQVEVLTRRRDDEVGTLLRIEGSRVVEQNEAQCPAGTNFKVKNLFFNTPARRRFLKTNSTELRNIINEFYRIVLVNPDVHFTFTSDGELLFDLPASSLKQRIDNVFGKSSRKSFASQLVDVKAETAVVSIYGYIGTPESATKQPQQYFFVNGRYMRHPYFHKAVLTSFAGMLAPEQQPHYFIYLSLNPELIDVNIHPTKTEIKFADEQMIWQILLAALRESLGKFNITPSLDFDREGDLDIPSSVNINPDNVHAPEVRVNQQYNPFNVNHTSNPAGWEKLYQPVAHSIVSAASDTLPETDLPTVSEQALFPADISLAQPSQYKERYILLPSADGLLFLDQHRAHAAVLYRQLREQISSKKGVMQQVLFPEVLDLSAEDSALLLQMKDELRSAGFEITQIARNSFSVDGVPAELGNSNPLRVLLDILHAVSETGVTTREQWEHRIALALSEAAAIPAGKTLQEDEMRDLVERFAALQDTSYSAEGKRIYALLSDSEIKKMF